MSSSLSLSAMAFLTSSFIVTLYEQSLKKRRSGVEASLLLKKAIASTSTSTTTATKHPSLTKEQIIELRRKHFLPNVSVSYANSGPLLILNGNGSRLIDEKGNSYLDTRNNVAHVGHGNACVVNAIQQQVAQLNTNTRYLHPNVVELAKRLTEKLPDPLEVVVFVNSGSEANDLALRLARAYTKSSNTIVVDRAYHGHTLATLEISPYKYEHSKEFTLQDSNDKNRTPSPGHHIWKVPCPDTYRGKYRDKTNAGQKYAAYVEEACNYYKERSEKVGGFCIEGGMSVAGVILPPTEYLRKSVEAVRSAGGVYIADEVQTGFGRLGSSYWAFQHGSDDQEERGGGVIPDIVTVGKPFGNGMPLGAVITTKAIADEFERMGVEYFNTFGGNPVSAAAGLAVLDVLETDRLQEHALEVGTYLQTRFRKLGLDLIGDVRGSGLFVGIELVRDVKTLEPATAETSFICTRLKEKFHILTSIDGLYDNVLVVKPPLVFTKADADYFVESFTKASVELKARGNDVLSMKKTPT